MAEIIFYFVVILCLISFWIAVKYWKEDERLTGVIQFIISTILALVTIGIQIWPQKVGGMIPGFSEIVEENEKLADDVNTYTMRIDGLNEEVDSLKSQIENLQNKQSIINEGTKKVPIDNSIPESDNNFEDITSLHPLIGNINEFFYSANGTLDNTGEECNGYMILCCSSSYDKKITFALDENYTQLKTLLRLRDADNSLLNSVWIEFYSVKDGKETKIGESERFKAGTRPTETTISLEGVIDLKIKVNSASSYTKAFLLTDGIFIK